MKLRWATCVVLALFGPTSVLAWKNKKDEADGPGTLPKGGVPAGLEDDDVPKSCKLTDRIRGRCRKK